MSQQNKLQGALVMSKADFWYLIEETRTSCGEDQETYLRHLGEWLKALGPDYAQDSSSTHTWSWRTNWAYGAPPP